MSAAAAVAADDLYTQRTTWRNDRGTTLVLEPCADGRLNGVLHLDVQPIPSALRTSSGSVTAMAPSLPCTGVWVRPSSSAPLPVVAWTVAWPAGATAWSGHWHVEERELRTMWIMTRQPADVDDAWDATLVGHDVFRQVLDGGQ